MQELGETSQLISQSGFWLAGLKTLAMLLIVLAFLILVLFLMRRFYYQKSSMGPVQIIKVISSYHVSPKGKVALIDVAGEKLLIGITSENISCLGRIKESKALTRLEEVKPLGSGLGIFDRLLATSLKGKAKSSQQ